MLTHLTERFCFETSFAFWAKSICIYSSFFIFHSSWIQDCSTDTVVLCPLAVVAGTNIHVHNTALFDGLSTWISVSAHLLYMCVWMYVCKIAYLNKMITSPNVCFQTDSAIFSYILDAVSVLLDLVDTLFFACVQGLGDNLNLNIHCNHIKICHYRLLLSKQN